MVCCMCMDEDGGDLRTGGIVDEYSSEVFPKEGLMSCEAGAP